MRLCFFFEQNMVESKDADITRVGEYHLLIFNELVFCYPNTSQYLKMHWRCSHMKNEFETCPKI